MFNSTSNDVAFRARDDVRNTVSGVDDSASQRPICGTVGCPGCGKGKHGLHSDVETLDVE